MNPEGRPKSTHCRNGHEKTPENTFKDGRCRECRCAYNKQLGGRPKVSTAAIWDDRHVRRLDARRLGNKWDAIIAQAALDNGIKGTAQAYGLELLTVAILLGAS